MSSKLRYLCFSLVLLFSVALLAQLENGIITGTVKDPSGAVVPNATVTVTSTTRGFTRSMTTGANGAYTITNLPPGAYAVKISAAGFGPYSQNAAVSVGGTTPVDATLALQASGTTVEVVGEGGAAVNTENQQLSNVVTTQQVTGLPTLTRNPYDLVATSGNVSEGDIANESQRGAGVSINGQRSASTDVLLDGGENVDLFDATVGQTVPLDSVQEFRVINSDFTAEYGRASGGIVNVATKSGTNSLHGTVYEFNRMSTLAANTFDNAANGVPKGRFVRNQFGYSVGGPIKKDRLFFFSSTEGLRVRSNAQIINLVPTPQFIAAAAPNTQAIFSQSGNLVPSAKVSQTFTAAQLPSFTAGPRVAALGGIPLFQQVTFTVPQDAGGGLPENGWFDVQRVDYNLSENTTLFGRYALQKEDQFPGTISFSPYAGFNTGQTVKNQNAMLSLNHIFSTSVVTSTKLLFNRLNTLQPVGSVVPTFFLSDQLPTKISGHNVALPGYLPYSPGSGIPFGGPQNVGEIYQDLTWTRGAHSLKFGGQFVYTQDNRVFGAFEEASEGFGHNNLSQALENFLAGNLFSFQAAIFPQGKFPCPVNPTTLKQVVTPSCQINLPVTPPNFSRSNRYRDGAAFAQDSWKVFPTFTLNLGLRWEYYGVQHNKNPNLDSNFYFGPGNTLPERIRNGSVLLAPQSPVGALWKPSWKNFGPRVGFAWDMFGNGRWSLRGGYGIAFERNFGNVTFNVIQNPPNYAVVSLIGGRDVPVLPASTSNFGPVSGAGGTVALPRTSLRAVRQDIGTAYSHMWSLGLEHELMRNTVLSLDYSGSRGLHLYTIENTNRLGSGVIYGGDVFTSSALAQADRLNRQFTNINMRGKSGFSYYNALNVGLRASNLWRTGLQATVNYTYAHSIDNLSTTFSESNNNFNLGLTDPFNPVLDKGNADFDIRHRVVVSALWDLPMFKNQPGLLGRILGGWTFAPIFQARTGTPFTMFDCTNEVQVCPRWDPGTGSIPRSVTANPALFNDPASGITPNVYNLMQLPLDPTSTPAAPVALGAGNPNDINPVLKISDFGPSCTAPGSGLIAPCQYPATMTHRNAFRGPNYWFMSAGLYKTFKLTERFGLQLRGEAFDLLNHHNFFVNGATTDVSGISYVQGKKGGLGLPTDERRHLQLAVKVLF